jgi:hypothetical protein
LPAMRNSQSSSSYSSRIGNAPRARGRLRFRRSPARHLGNDTRPVPHAARAPDAPATALTPSATLEHSALRTGTRPCASRAAPPAAASASARAAC